MDSDSGYKGAAPTILSPENNPYRAKLIKLAQTGEVMYVHPCSVCGNNNGYFGYNKNPSGKVDKPGYWKFIEWFCNLCRPDKPKDILTQKKLL